MAKRMVEVAGIADAHGIESYFPVSEKRDVSTAILRASLNRQRHAVAYVAKVPATVDAEIKRCIEGKNFVAALEVLQMAVGFGTATVKLAGGGDVVGSWRLIPNPDLDPWA